MSYIGRTPQIGAYHKLDAITTDGSASYTMQLDSANFVPESVNHLIVSVNGVIQAPTDSFTVSGSTITFASSLSVSDTIDFIMALGNVLDIGVPSDATVSLSKLTATGTKDATTFLRGDNTFAVPPSTVSDNSITMAKLSTSATEGDNVKQRVAKVWVRWNGTGTPSIDDDFNVSSIDDGGTGIFTVNFSSNLGSATYAVAGSVGGNSGRILGLEGAFSSSAVTVRTNTFNGTLTDETRNSVIIFGDSA